jgi:uncharacterized membrane protein
MSSSGPAHGGRYPGETVGITRMGNRRSVRIDPGAVAERLRGSLFFVPLAFVVAGVFAGLAMVELDQRVDDPGSLPFVLTATVDSAREILTVVAAATITIAGIAFSISVLVIQLASSQYSPRAVQALFRDPFNRRVMGVVLGTFTYCLLVLSAVRSAAEEGGSEVVPNLGASLAIVLGVLSILAVVAFIDHSAHAIEVSEILTRLRDEATSRFTEQRSDDPDVRSGARPATVPDGPGLCVTFDRSGWVQRIHHQALLGALAEGGTVRLESATGRFAVAGTPLCTVWPSPNDPEGFTSTARDAVRVGPTRTMEQDATYGIRQLADVALKALSTGVNDPTTAQDAIFNMAAVLREALVRPEQAEVEHDEGGRRLLRAAGDTGDDELISLAYDELRRQSAPLPAVSRYLLRSLHLLVLALDDAGQGHRAGPLRAQADLILTGAERADLLPEDLEPVRRTYEAGFGDRATA